jgi:hypothetical protein
MAELRAKSSAGNVVQGFSKRFNLLMDRSGFPKQNRTSAGARRFEVVHNTFKNWCVADKIPGTHSLLIEIVGSLLQDVPGRHNPKAVAAWLLAGDAVPNPFGDDTGALAFVDLYLQISQIAKREGINFDKLSRESRNVILTRVRAMLPASATNADEGLRLDKAGLSKVIGMLEMARTMT